MSKKQRPRACLSCFANLDEELTAAIDDTAENRSKNRISVNCRRQSEDGQNIRRRILKQLCRKQNENKCRQNDQILPDEPDERVNESVINEQKMIEQKLSKLQNLLEKQMGTAKETGNQAE